MPRCAHLVLAVVVSIAAPCAWAQSCTFNAASSGIVFTPFDPSAPSTQTAFTTLGIKCVSASGTPTPVFTFSGLYGSAPLRMKHSVQNAFINYTVSTARISVQGANQEWRVTAQVLGADYVNAFAGNYGDTLTVSITP